MKFLILFIYLITTSFVYAIEKPDIKNIVIIKNPKTYEEIVFKDEIGRLRDIQVHPNNGKIYFLTEDSLWLMEKS